MKKKERKKERKKKRKKERKKERKKKKKRPAKNYAFLLFALSICLKNVLTYEDTFLRIFHLTSRISILDQLCSNMEEQLFKM